MTAADIIGKDFEFRLGVDLGGTGEQQIAAVERRRCAYRSRLYNDPAIEYAAPVAGCQAMEYLPAVRVGCAMVDSRVVVDMAVAIDDKCTMNIGCRARTIQCD